MRGRIVACSLWTSGMWSTCIYKLFICRKRKWRLFQISNNFVITFICSSSFETSRNSSIISSTIFLSFLILYTRYTFFITSKNQSSFNKWKKTSLLFHRHWYFRSLPNYRKRFYLQERIVNLHKNTRWISCKISSFLLRRREAEGDESPPEAEQRVAQGA